MSASAIVKGNVRKSTPMCLLRGLVSAVLATVLLVLLLTVLVLMLDWGSEVITPVNQVIKVLSILAGTFMAAGGMKGWIAGLSVGALYMALGIILYCAFAGTLLPWIVMAGDLALGCVSGFLSGMLAGTLKR